MGYEHREDALRGRVAGKGKHTHKHTHTHSVRRDTQGGWSHGQGSDTILTHVGMATPLIKLMGYEHREDAERGEGACNSKNTHTHTHSVARDTQDGWSLGQRSDTILTHVGLAPPQIKLMGYEHREDALGGGEAGKGKHTHTHTVSPVIHRVD